MGESGNFIKEYQYTHNKNHVLSNYFLFQTILITKKIYEKFQKRLQVKNIIFEILITLNFIDVYT